MNRHLFLLFGCCSLGLLCRGQAPPPRMLYIIDSFLVQASSRLLAQLPEEAIAYKTVVTDKDSLKRLGRENAEAVTYIFTREYRNRPDSLKKIPSLRQMNLWGGYWYRNGTPYTGKFIDYFLEGTVCNEGSMVEGKIHGEIIQYYRNGRVKLSAFYLQGLADGLFQEYFRNGALRRSRVFLLGKIIRPAQTYFVNGALEQEIRPGKGSRPDTITTYYSSGQLKHVHLVRNGFTLYSKKEEKQNTLAREFQGYLRTGDLKQANRNFYKLWKMNPNSPDTYYLEGLLAQREARFDEAIAAFGKALELEPMMGEAYTQRALARIKKYKVTEPAKKFANRDYKPSQGRLRREAPITQGDIEGLPPAEQEAVHKDLRQAEFLNYTSD
ncbi:hypothetical protein V9K67_01675 [Paraflavisolibacter sp. H34]|uniref:hypothetical protein n=1 Tax=Huijunlia imazamoxiresistens TaxID=3127457 RepID=UPI00301A3495